MNSPELISKDAFLGTTSTFFAIAIILAVLRTGIRVYKWRRLFLDDVFFLLAVVCHIISTGLVFDQVPDLYMFATLLSNKTPLPADFIQVAADSGAASILNTIWASETLIWGTIFAVKFSFLFYFRTLVWQIRNLRLVWWATLIFITPVAGVCIASPWIICPYTGDEILLQCVVKPGFLHREKVILGVTVTFDILTDVMLICIPVRLLQQTRFKIREKVNIGIVLCLSIVIIAISLVRAISFGVIGTLDQVWDEFWVQMESSISIIVVCMTAFRTLFVTNQGNQRNNNSPRTGRNWRQYRSPWSREESRDLPDIETGARMTGMRTVIRENGRTTLGEFGASDFPLKSMRQNHGMATPVEGSEPKSPSTKSFQPSSDTSPLVGRVQ